MPAHAMSCAPSHTPPPARQPDTSHSACPDTATTCPTTPPDGSPHSSNASPGTTPTTTPPGTPPPKPTAPPGTAHDTGGHQSANTRHSPTQRLRQKG
ncbi:hypothetical protein QR98_0049640 [Sarcoptes scabiei]|uniref:Uncharacterized protein n=1 Tax=Sarcoptes scabiei TaxID=52283 RepID=A0A132A6C6_SARSC|nr:hypothetical protein QR98_0049640 [Sarcoptes scabiei]